VSGKRSLKKQQKRQTSALAQLEDLYRRGADDEFLARAAEQVADLAASPFAAKWAEVADRALRQSLARSDLDRLERLLRSLRRSGPLRPLGVLAEGVLDLAAGRLDAARSRLAALAASKDLAAALPPSLLADLQALARDEPDQPQEDEVCPRAAADLFAALQGLEARAFAPTAADCEALARYLQTLRALAPAEDVDLRRILDGADRCLSLLTGLAALETRLSHLPEGDKMRESPEVVAWLRGSGLLLAATLSASAPPLLAPLHHAVQTRWRAVLDRVEAQEGSPGLVALWAADPKLLAHHVDLPGGIQGGHERFRQRAQAQQLLAAERYEELAGLLRSRSRTVSDPGDLAAFWSLEMWACNRWTPDEQDEDGEDLLLPDLSDPFPHRTLVRLGEMAGQIGQRFPAGQRAEVARVLRDDLLELCREVRFCDHTAGAALALLEYQPGDTGLLIVGVAGAVAGGAPRALRAFDALIDRVGNGGKASTEDRLIEKRLMARVAGMPPRALARALATVRPLFSMDAWPEITELVAAEISGYFVDTLDAACFMASMHPQSVSLALREARDELIHLRPALGETLGFAAVELALDCWQPDPRKVEKRLAGFLGGFPGYEAALAALQVLGKALSPWSPKGIHLALDSLAQAVIDRLDDRWQLWYRAVPALAINADKSHRKRLEKKVQQLLASPEIQAEGREVLGKCLDVIHHVETTKRELDQPRPRPQRRKKPRRRRSDVPQISLDFP
jgi:hypothetical protein